MGAEEAVSILYKNEIDSLNGEDREELIRDKVSEYQRSLVDVENAAKEGIVDAVIKPRETAEYIYKCLGQRDGGETDFFKHTLNPM